MSTPDLLEHPLLPSLRTHFLRRVGRGMEMTLPHTLSLESTTNYSSFNTKNYSSLYLPPLMQSGGSNLGDSSLSFVSSPVDPPICILFNFLFTSYNKLRNRKIGKMCWFLNGVVQNNNTVCAIEIQHTSWMNIPHWHEIRDTSNESVIWNTESKSLSLLQGKSRDATTRWLDRIKNWCENTDLLVISLF